MKKIFILAIVLGLLVSVNSFARDVEHLQDITNWTIFISRDGRTSFYEHEEGSPNIPKMYKFKDAIGYEYFYTKNICPQKELDELQKALSERHEKEFKNIKLGYTIGWYRIDCKNQMVECIELYCYSDENKLIISFDLKGTSAGKIKLAGSPFESIPFNRDRIRQTKQEAQLMDKKNEILKKYGAEAFVTINQLEVNPYEFEGHTIAVVVQFKKMLSKNSASFYSGYIDLSEYTQVPDEIIVSGIPSGTHFESGMMSPRMLLVLEGKGTIEGTNAFGARIKAPHFQWKDIISGKQPSVLEEQRNNAR